MHFEKGDMITFERKFTKEDVELFIRVSNDEGIHHREVDELDRLVVHGLLTATLPTKIGGDLNVLARTMNFEFFRPVYTGDTILCKVIIERFEKYKPNRIAIESTFSCTNQYNEEVMAGNFTGVILTED